MAAETEDRRPRYRLRLDRARARYIDVVLALPASESGWRLSLPAWIPGSYLIRDFAKNLVGMRAQRADGGVLPIHTQDKQTWTLPPSDQPVEIHYAVYCADFSVRTAHVDSEHAFFNGTSVFLRVHGLESAGYDVRLEAEGVADNWRVATTLPARATDDRGFGDYVAEDYEALIDHPFECGRFELLEFEARGVPHRMVFVGADPDTDFARIGRDVARICETEIDLFDGAPFEQYLFMTTLDADGFGGLEHRDSTALIFPRADLPLVGEQADRGGEIDPKYQRFLSLCAHEYFHSWNVKRIRPAVFEGLPLAEPAYTRLLWLFEGFTSYFDDWLVRRAGLVSEAGYLKALEQTINRAIRGKGWSRQTLEESSFYAWTRFYQQDENAVNAIVSYYTRGALVALMLDLMLRRDGKSLVDVMRRLWAEHATTGLPEGAVVEQLIESVADRPLADFFDRALRGTEPLDFLPELEAFGVRVEPVAERSGPDIGCTVTAGRDPNIQLVFEDRAAQQAGLAAGDQIVALDGFAVATDFMERIARHRPGDQVCVHVFRRGRLLAFDVTLAEPVRNQLRLLPAPDDGADAVTRRRAWLATV